MDKEDTGTDGISESELLGFLASLKAEPTPEADFEGRFLYDLRERLARETVCCPARRLLWDHLMQLLANVGLRKLACGASALGLGAFALSFFALPEQPDGSGMAVTKGKLSLLEHSMAALRPNSGQEAHNCTTIRICEQKAAPYTDASLASGALPASFADGLTPSSVQTIPVNMGMESGLRSVFPSFSTTAGF